jgi:hypothetical protein
MGTEVHSCLHPVKLQCVIKYQLVVQAWGRRSGTLAHHVCGLRTIENITGDVDKHKMTPGPCRLSEVILELLIDFLVCPGVDIIQHT